MKFCGLLSIGFIIASGCSQGSSVPGALESASTATTISPPAPTVTYPIPNLQMMITASGQDWVVYLGSLTSSINNGVTSDLPICAASGKSLMYFRYREVGDALRDGARTLPFVTDPATNQQLSAALTTLAATIMGVFSGGTFTDYASCYDASGEFQTSYQVVVGLNEVNLVLPNPNIPTYIISSWNQVLPMFQALGNTIVNDGFVAGQIVYDGFGQYLKFAAITQALGVDSFQASFTAIGIQKLFQGQVLTASQAACGKVTLAYGSWPHSASADCTQYLGYNRFILEGLIDLEYYLISAYGTSGNCDSYWQFACANIPDNILADLAFISNLQEASGALYEWAPSSNPLTPTDGTYDGQLQYFRVFVLAQKLGISNSTEIQYDFAGDTKTLATIITSALASVKYYDVTLNTGIISPEFLVYLNQ